jgi:hypothetical protein
MGGLGRLWGVSSEKLTLNLRGWGRNRTAGEGATLRVLLGAGKVGDDGLREGVVGFARNVGCSWSAVRDCRSLEGRTHTRGISEGGYEKGF